MLLAFLFTGTIFSAEHLFVYQIKKGGERMAKGKVTSPRAASAASKVLRDGRTSKASKTAAGSALSQRPSKK